MTKTVDLPEETVTPTDNDLFYVLDVETNTDKKVKFSLLASRIHNALTAAILNPLFTWGKGLTGGINAGKVEVEITDNSIDAALIDGTDADAIRGELNVPSNPQARAIVYSTVNAGAGLLKGQPDMDNNGAFDMRVDPAFILAPSASIYGRTIAAYVLPATPNANIPTGTGNYLVQRLAQARASLQPGIATTNDWTLNTTNGNLTWPSGIEPDDNVFGLIIRVQVNNVYVTRVVAPWKEIDPANAADVEPLYISPQLKLGMRFSVGTGNGAYRFNLIGKVDGTGDIPANTVITVHEAVAAGAQGPKGDPGTNAEEVPDDTLLPRQLKADTQEEREAFQQRIGIDLDELDYTSIYTGSITVGTSRGSELHGYNQRTGSTDRFGSIATGTLTEDGHTILAVFQNNTENRVEIDFSGDVRTLYAHRTMEINGHNFKLSSAASARYLESSYTQYLFNNVPDNRIPMSGNFNAVMWEPKAAGDHYEESGTDIRNKLELLTGNNRLSASAIRNLPTGGPGGGGNIAIEQAGSGTFNLRSPAMRFIAPVRFIKLPTDAHWLIFEFQDAQGAHESHWIDEDILLGTKALPTGTVLAAGTAGLPANNTNSILLPDVGSTGQIDYRLGRDNQGNLLIAFASTTGTVGVEIYKVQTAPIEGFDFDSPIANPDQSLTFPVREKDDMTAGSTPVTFAGISGSFAPNTQPFDGYNIRYYATNTGITKFANRYVIRGEPASTTVRPPFKAIIIDGTTYALQDDDLPNTHHLVKKTIPIFSAQRAANGSTFNIDLQYDSNRWFIGGPTSLRTASKDIIQQIVGLGNDVDSFPENPIAGTIVNLLEEQTLAGFSILKPAQGSSSGGTTLYGYVNAPRVGHLDPATDDIVVLAYYSNNGVPGNFARRNIIWIQSTDTRTVSKVFINGTSYDATQLGQAVDKTWYFGTDQLIRNGVEISVQIEFSDGTNLFPDITYEPNHYEWTGHKWIEAPGYVTDDDIDARIALWAQRNNNERIPAAKFYRKMTATQYAAETDKSGLILVSG